MSRFLQCPQRPQPFSLTSHLRVGDVRALGLGEYTQAKHAGDLRAKHMEAILEQTLFADPRDRVRLWLPLGVVELGGPKELGRRTTRLSDAVVEHHRRVDALPDRRKRPCGIADQYRLSAIKLGAGELSPDVVTGAPGKRRDGLLTRQLEYARNAIMEEAACFFPG